MRPLPGRRATVVGTTTVGAAGVTATVLPGETTVAPEELTVPPEGTITAPGAGVSTLVGLLPILLGFALARTVTLAAWFGGAALLAVAVAHPAPQEPGGGDPNPRASEATASPKNPTARPN